MRLYEPVLGPGSDPEDLVPNGGDLAARNRALTVLFNARVANTERDKEERARAREADRADRERRREEERGEKEKLRLLALAERDRQREAAKMAAKYPVDDAQVQPSVACDRPPQCKLTSLLMC